MTVNDEGITIDDVKNYKLLGAYNNYWRKRRVEVYEHPSDPSKIVTVGYPMPNNEIHSEPIVCVESYDGTVRGRVEYNDWSDYH
jgi:hypothetical protein